LTSSCERSLLQPRNIRPPSETSFTLRSASPWFRTVDGHGQTIASERMKLTCSLMLHDAVGANVWAPDDELMALRVIGSRTRRALLAMLRRVIFHLVVGHVSLFHLDSRTLPAMQRLSL